MMFLWFVVAKLSESQIFKEIKNKDDQADSIKKIVEKNFKQGMGIEHSLGNLWTIHLWSFKGELIANK